MIYEDITLGPVRLILGDCMKIAPTLGKFDAVITDPPYGIGMDGVKASTSKHGGRKPHEFRGWDSKPPNKEFFDMCFSISQHQCFWGGNYFSNHLPPKMGWLVWDKGQDICSSDCELAFTSNDSALRRKVLNRIELKKEGTSHPTQKPVKLMVWTISHFPMCKTILDPFMGSGTTLIAAIRTGRKAIGIEIDPKHYRTAVERVRRELAQGTLPLQSNPQPKQEALL